MSKAINVLSIWKISTEQILSLLRNKTVKKVNKGYNHLSFKLLVINKLLKVILKRKMIIKMTNKSFRTEINQTNACLDQ